MSGKRKALVRIAACAVVAALAGCSSDSGRASAPTEASPISTTTTAPVDRVTVSIGWDNRCNVSWRAQHDDLFWKATNAPESWGRSLDEAARTGTVQAASAIQLTYRDDDGTIVNFEIDDPSETPCS